MAVFPLVREQTLQAGQVTETLHKCHGGNCWVASPLRVHMVCCRLSQLEIIEDKHLEDTTQQHPAGATEATTLTGTVAGTTPGQVGRPFSAVQWDTVLASRGSVCGLNGQEDGRLRAEDLAFTGQQLVNEDLDSGTKHLVAVDLD